MGKIITLSILIISIFCTGCEKNSDNNSVDFKFEATVINKGVDCGETFTISLKSMDTESAIQDGIYYADNLDFEFKVPGLKINLNCREPSDEELYPCTEMGISYPHVIVTDCTVKED